MDFTPSDAQQAMVGLADRIMGDHLDMGRHLAVETAGGWFDRDLWEDLASAGLLGIALGTDVGGSGLDVVALALLLGVQGSHVAPLPLLPSSVAAVIVDQHGSDEQRHRLLRRHHADINCTLTENPVVGSQRFNVADCSSV